MWLVLWSLRQELGDKASVLCVTRRVCMVRATSRMLSVGSAKIPKSLEFGPRCGPGGAVVIFGSGFWGPLGAGADARMVECARARSEEGGGIVEKLKCKCLHRGEWAWKWALFPVRERGGR